LVGTTNASEYLRDATGNRRIWPVKCLSAEGAGADLAWLRVNRDQLWAEAADREAAGESIWLDNAAVREVALAAQAERLSEDPWHEKIRDHIEGKQTTTVIELFDHALFVPTVQQTKGLEMRVANILKILGWKKGTVWDAAQQKAVKVWQCPDYQPALPPTGPK
jgi:putative DNA primase/helicase